MYVLRNIEERLRNHCCCGKEISIKYCGSVCVALVIQHAKRIRHIIFSSVACLAPPYFFTLSHKRQDFRKNSQHKMYVWILSTNLSKTFLIPGRIQRDIVINVKTSSSKVPVMVVRF